MIMNSIDSAHTRIIREGYGLDRDPTHQEMEDLKASLRRKADKGSLDDHSETIYLALDLDKDPQLVSAERPRS